MRVTTAEMTPRTKVVVKPEKMENTTCRRLVFQGPTTSRLFQVREIDRIKVKVADLCMANLSLFQNNIFHNFN